MNIVIKPPSQLTKDIFVQLILLIAKGSQINMAGISERIKKADLIAMMIDDDKIITTASLKNPNTDYKEDVFEMAGVKSLEKEFTKELGYIVTHPKYEGKKLCQQLLIEFIPLIKGNNIFATTRKASMAHILAKFGFHKIGSTYKEDLELLVRKAFGVK